MFHYIGRKQTCEFLMVRMFLTYCPHKHERMFPYSFKAIALAFLPAMLISGSAAAELLPNGDRVPQFPLKSKRCLVTENEIETARKNVAEHGQARKVADAIIAHIGTTVGGSIGVTDATVTMDEAAERVQKIIDAAKTVREDVIFLSHGGPISKPEDAAHINEATEAVGFVGASSLERLAVEESLTEITRQFKQISVPAAARLPWLARN